MEVSDYLVARLITRVLPLAKQPIAIQFEAASRRFAIVADLVDVVALSCCTEVSRVHWNIATDGTTVLMLLVRLINLFDLVCHHGAFLDLLKAEILPQKFRSRSHWRTVKAAPCRLACSLPGGHATGRPTCAELAIDIVGGAD